MHGGVGIQTKLKPDDLGYPTHVYKNKKIQYSIIKFLVDEQIFYNVVKNF